MKSAAGNVQEMIAKRFQSMNLKELALLSIAGQGGKMAAEVIAAAAVMQGKHTYVAATLAGVRRMAPNTQVVRIADSPGIPSGELALMPSQLMVTSESLLKSIDELMRRTIASFHSGVLMVCTDKTPEQVDFPLSFEGTIATADAETIFSDIVGIKPPPFCIAALGLYAAATGTVDYELIRKAAAERLHGFRPSVIERNMAALDAVYKSTKVSKNVKLVRKQTKEQYETYRPPVERGSFKLLGASSENALAFWRDKLPVCDQRKCTCIECIVAYFCPEGIVRWKDEVYTVDYEFCKGCGICAHECPNKAITMKPEKDVLAITA